MAASTRPQDLISPRYHDDGKARDPYSPSQVAAAEGFHEAIRSGKLAFEELNACPLCKSPEQPVIALKDRHGEANPITCCPSCGLVYVWRRFDPKSLAAFYAEYYRYVFDDENPEATIDQRFALARASYAGRIDRAIKFLNLNPKRDVIVEIGCGGGWNLAPYADRGFRVMGFDYDENYLSIGRARGLELYNLNNTTLEEKVSGVSLIIATEVLEHSPDPIAFLKRLHPLLNANGHLYLTVPSLWEIPFGYGEGDPLEEFQIAHLFLFDPKTFAATLGQAGFCPKTDRSDLRIFASRMAAPSPPCTSISGNFARNMQKLRFSDRFGRHAWEALFQLCGENFPRYYRISRTLCLMISPHRLWNFLDRRFRTGL